MQYLYTGDQKKFEKVKTDVNHSHYIHNKGELEWLKKRYLEIGEDYMVINLQE